MNNIAAKYSALWADWHSSLHHISNGTAFHLLITQKGKNWPVFLSKNHLYSEGTRIAGSGNYVRSTGTLDFRLLDIWLQLFRDVPFILPGQRHVLRVAASCDHLVILVDEADRGIRKRLADCSRINTLESLAAHCEWQSLTFVTYDLASYCVSYFTSNTKIGDTEIGRDACGEQTPRCESQRATSIYHTSYGAAMEYAKPVGMLLLDVKLEVDFARGSCCHAELQSVSRSNH